MAKTVEFSVVPVTRYLVIRVEQGMEGAAQKGYGEFDRKIIAQEVANALRDAEASRPDG